MYRCLKVIVLVFLLTLTASTEESARKRKAQLVRKYMRKYKKLEGAVRLLNGGGDHEGNVEVFHMGKWGSVCDDEWDAREARVVCRQMGYDTASKPTHSSHFGQPSSKYLMDNVYCVGDETRLSDCRFDGWGNHDCGSEEAAGVVCLQEEVVTTTAPPPPPPPPKHKVNLQKVVKDRIKLRLVGGRVPEEGRIQIKTNRSDWGEICGDGWTLLEGNVVCRRLGLGYALAATQTNYFQGGTGEVVLSGVECRGNESGLEECSSHNTTECPGSNHNVAGVVCTSSLADLVVDTDEVLRSAYLEDRQLFSLQCAMEENCLATSAYRVREDSPAWHLETRRLLRFTASVRNAGTADFRPSLPKNLWEFHQCHMHYHSMEVFATFDVLSGSERVAEGHKASFCLEDNVCDVGTTPRFACANFGDQGIAVNCTDVYKHNIDCQWVDVTDLEPGTYTFKIAINPEFKVAEMSFENNAAVCRLDYTMTSALISDCYLTRP